MLERWPMTIATFLIALMALPGCDRIDELLGGGDDESDEASDDGDEQPLQPVQPATPPIGEPQAGGPQAAAGDGGAVGDSVCARATRCCDAAGNVQNFPQIYAAQREATCRAIHENANLDDDGCRTAMGLVRQLFRMVNQAPPEACLEGTP